MADQQGAALLAGWAPLMPVIILGGIYGGTFTPTEASAVAVFYARVPRAQTSCG